MRGGQHRGKAVRFRTRHELALEMEPFQRQPDGFAVADNDLPSHSRASSTADSRVAAVWFGAW
jgi:hypothetical protein